MNTGKWLALAERYNTELAAAGLTLTAHEATAPAAPPTNAANLLLAMKLQHEYMRARIAHVSATQKLLLAMTELQERAMRHLERAPPEILREAQSIMENA